MIVDLTARLLDRNSPSWSARIDALRTLLGAPANPTLLPPHFVEVTLPRIGGHVVQFEHMDGVIAAGFLFPRTLQRGKPSFTMRLHPAAPALTVDPEQVCRLAEDALGASEVRFYDPAAAHRFEPGAERIDGMELGRPDAASAQAMRAIQSQVWGSPPDYLYPTDIHSSDFEPASSLVAREAGQVVGYLFGFTKFGGDPLPEQWQGRVRCDLRIESQQMAVLPACRGRGVATMLKARQAELARQAGIEVVNWTADPLQWPNAVLNLSRLRAVAFDFFPAMYRLRNELNRVAPSRLVLTWLVSSRRVVESLQPAAEAGAAALHGWAAIRRVNAGPDDVLLDAADPAIAVEIPADWTALQVAAPDEALRWRKATDAILLRYLGSRPGQYVVTGAAQDGRRRYLVAQRMTPALLDSLIQKDEVHPWTK